MPWYSIYDEKTGHLVSVGTELADPLPEGLAVLETEEKPQGPWDTDIRWKIFSHPPEGYQRIKNIYLDIEGGGLILEFDPVGGGPTSKFVPLSALQSKPPSGQHKICNIWRNAGGNPEYEWEDKPEP